ncbi:lipoate-protein ligase [Emydomyces testavorans]|uniref:Putative lipoate-protein ligase A n=1 Tax=Emydomyces testavorans TaxID=2070801 RepID=A0AAF0IG95_9EURO|nr:lipoate-protein ligase [Emydomyces testavorans]
MLPPRHLHWSLLSNASTRHIFKLKSSRSTLLCRQFLHTSHHPSDFPILVNQPSAEHQIYQSLSTDPYVNLSIENFLYNNTPNDSKILFLYVNRPTVVIGRNQNPWLETNLHLLNRNQASKNGIGDVILLRRRSGGGAVFHDEGNLNFSVICPKPIFHRDKHAEMIVRALHKLGAVSTSVNARHDIVMSQDCLVPPPKKVVQVGTDDIESPLVVTTPRAVKISGSAYKLSRFRALHHGTCLIDSPNLDSIGTFLRSPARPYLRAKGVESVRSPVGNVSSTLKGLSEINLSQLLVAKIMDEFALLYNVDAEALSSVQELGDEPGFRSGTNWVVGAVTHNNSVGVKEIEDDIREFQSLEWTYNQCPQFTFSTHPTEEDPRLRPDLPSHLHPSVCILSANLSLHLIETHVFLRLKSGKITESQISMASESETAAFQSHRIHKVLQGRTLHEILDWKTILNDVSGLFSSPQDALNLADWLNSKLGR